GATAVFAAANPSLAFADGYFDRGVRRGICVSRGAFCAAAARWTGRTAWLVGAGEGDTRWPRSSDDRGRIAGRFVLRAGIRYGAGPTVADGCDAAGCEWRAFGNSRRVDAEVRSRGQDPGITRSCKEISDHGERARSRILRGLRTRGECVYRKAWEPSADRVPHSRL